MGLRLKSPDMSMLGAILKTIKNYYMKIEIRRGEETNRLKIIAELIKQLPDDLFERKTGKNLFTRDCFVATRDFSVEFEYKIHDKEYSKITDNIIVTDNLILTHPDFLSLICALSA